MSGKKGSNTEYEYPSFTRRELWLYYFEENRDYDLKEFSLIKNKEFINENGEEEKLLGMMTPTAVSLTVNTEKELIKIMLKPKFILKNPKNDIQQTAYEVGVAQTFRVKDFKKIYFNKSKETYVIPKEFANKLIYYTFVAAIGMIASLPKKKSIGYYNLHYSDAWKKTMKEDIICSDEDFLRIEA
jgi:hypothetical protein